MILAFDTFYLEDTARTVCIEFEEWSAATPCKIYEETLKDIAPYVSGQFYKRELPCILSLLKQIDLSNCTAIIIDGFVVLDDNESLGLGGYLYKSLEEKIPVIGVAKNDFSKLSTRKKAVYRGQSKKPLYVTTMGMELEKASDYIQYMYGDYRLPELLKKVDALGRS